MILFEINNMLEPLVSVIIPNYCHEQYLDERIQTILNQTYQNFELIILDDCSTDNSKDVINKYANNPHISHIVFNEINSGSTFIQWEKGFKLSQGEYIWIAESDDSSDSRFLEKLVSTFQNNSNNILSFCCSMVIDNHGIPKDIIQKQRFNKTISGITFIKRYLSRDNIIYNASSVIFKKNALYSIDKDYMKYKASGDWLFWIEICKLGDITMIDLPLNNFRKHHYNITERHKCNGIQQYENKLIYNKLNSLSILSKKELFIIKFNSIYNILFNTSFNTKETKAMVIKEWNPSLFMYSICFLRKLRIDIIKTLNR